ncbi:hypothetical protein AKJ51_00180 [candidate division MSBL1 archaeon SCGC-AAA382A20]|uniref:Uncharacterized protein n=1 Tax=candidate division MSBL1 archaeon SCGC-AAA382A20 TaxID=1698280 RepID=A0A133VMY1_9EURY|nr:hypothetical protein AKJ51_00180 [candidate division MSBL1 archaeon SCGC-AAA382A20]
MFLLDSELDFFEKINNTIYSSNLNLENETFGALDENWYEEYTQLYKDNPKAKSYAKRLNLSQCIINLRSIIPRNPSGHTEPCSNISETYLKPPSQMSEDNNFYIKCLGNHEVYGSEVNCVPYINPNPYFGVCAQAALWICFKILEKRYGISSSSYTLPEIQDMAFNTPFSDSIGLVFPHISRIFKMNHCQSFVYNNTKMGLSDEEMIDIIYAYIESELPVILGIDVSELDWWGEVEEDYHAIVLIGHTMDESTGKIDGFILHDESKYPYLTIDIENLLRAWDIPDKAKDSPEVNHRVAVVGTPPAIKFGYEAALDHQTQLEILYEQGKIETNEFNLWPILIPSGVFSLWWDTLEYKNQEFGEFVENKMRELWEDVKLNNRYIWALRMFESNEKRLETSKEFKGLLLVDAENKDRLLFLIVEDECVGYYSTEEQEFTVDSYPQTN